MDKVDRGRACGVQCAWQDSGLAGEASNCTGIDVPGLRIENWTVA